MTSAIRLLGRWLPALLWAALIYVASDQSRLPQAPNHLLDVLLKKSGHFAAYALLAMLVLQALGGPSGGRTRRRFVLTWLLAVLYAITDEIHQSYVPGRTAAALDVVIDGAGALLGLSLRAALRRFGMARLPANWWQAFGARGS
jgi:VanZ family protein